MCVCVRVSECVLCVCECACVCVKERGRQERACACVDGAGTSLKNNIFQAYACVHRRVCVLKGSATGGKGGS